jgi:hypothetical protein
MNYVDPVKYRNTILSLMEDEMPQTEETVPVKGEMSMKERIANLSPDKKEKLKQYVEAIKEIKQEIYELIHESLEEEGGNMSSGLTLNTEVKNPYFDRNNVDRGDEMDALFPTVFADLKSDANIYAGLVIHLLFHWVYGTGETGLMKHYKNKFLKGKK